MGSDSLLEFLVDVVDAELFEVVALEDLETVDVQDAHRQPGLLELDRQVHLLGGFEGGAQLQ